MGFRASDATSAKLRRATAWLLVALAVRAAPVVALAGTASAQSDAQLPTGSSAAPPAPRVAYAGLPNFGVVSDQLYRGAQPADSGFAELKALGIAIVVNLRHESDRIARERRLVESLGLHYVSIPWRGYDEPKPEQVAQFLRLLRDNPGRKVFVHCERGAERTGVMVACYRISREQWPPERAQAEMEAFGFRRRFAHLTRFVREFPAILARDPVLRSTIPRRLHSTEQQRPWVDAMALLAPASDGPPREIRQYRSAPWQVCGVSCPISPAVSGSRLRIDWPFAGLRC